MKKQYLFLFFVIFSVIFASVFIAGCARKECKVSTDCTSNSSSAYTASCEENKCKYTPIPNKCGNGKCEANVNENKCSCAEDCGKPANSPPTGCSGTNGSLSYACANNVCYLNLTQSQQKSIPVQMNIGQINVMITSSYNQPFDASTSEIKFKFQLESKAKEVSELKIKKVQVLSRDQYGAEQVLGEKEINRIIWSSSSADSFEVKVPLTKFEGLDERRNVAGKIFYEFKTEYGGELIPTTDSYAFDVQQDFSLVKSTIPVKCIPALCDDSNPGTRDSCSSFGFCENTPVQNSCGNFVCDASENKCTCRIDCGPCEGDAGEFLAYVCKANQCVTQLKTAARQVSIEDNPSMQYFKLSIATTFEEPFDVKTSKFRASISLDDFQDSFVAPLKITKIQILEGEIKIAETTEEQSLSKRGDKFDVEIPVLYTPAKSEEEKSVALKITYNHYYRQQAGTDYYGKPVYENVFVTDSYSKSFATPIKFIKTG